MDSKIVVGYIGPLKAKDLRIGGRSSAAGAGRAQVDLAYARDLAERRTGTAAEAAVGRQLVNLANQGGDVAALAKAMGELFAIGEGVLTEQPSPVAVAAANRLLEPAGVAALGQQEGGADLIVLAYAVIHYDEVRRLNGGLS